MSFLSLLLMGGVIAGLNLDTHPTVVGILAAFAFCLREALDPMLPGLWHHRRLRPIASLVIVALAIGFASLLRHPAWTILACAIMIFHRHMAGALRLFNQNLIEVDALATRLRAMDTERLLKQAVYLQTVTAADTQPRAHDALSS